MEADSVDVGLDHVQSNLWNLSQGDDEFQTPSSIAKTTMNVEDAVNEVVHAFRAAAEREITLGDGLDVWIFSSNDGSNDISAVERHDNTEEMRIKRYNNKVTTKLEKRFYSLPKH